MLPAAAAMRRTRATRGRPRRAGGCGASPPEGRGGRAGERQSGQGKEAAQCRGGLDQGQPWCDQPHAHNTSLHTVKEHSPQHSALQDKDAPLSAMHALAGPTCRHTKVGVCAWMTAPMAAMRACRCTSSLNHTCTARVGAG